MTYATKILLLLALLTTASLTAASDPIFYSGSLPEVQKALKKFPNDIDVQHPNTKQTPLMSATLRGKADVVEYLLAQGADWKVSEKDGYNPPHGAGFQGRPDVMSLLIKHGIPVNEAHSDGFTPLHRACWGREERHAETVRVLVEEGSVDAFTKSTVGIGRTCLQMTQNPKTKEYLSTLSNKSDL
jgi:ankyrin repeat protein